MNLYFLKLDGIRGESNADRHFAEIDLLGFTWGDVHKAATAGIGAGKASFNDLTIFKKGDRTSPEFMLASTDGRHFEQATLTVETISESGGLLRTVSVHMQALLVNTFRALADSHDSPSSASEEVGLKFAHMKIVKHEAQK